MRNPQPQRRQAAIGRPIGAIQRQTAAIQRQTAAIQHGTAWLLSIAAVAAFAALTALNAGNAPAWTAFTDIGEALAAILATAACVVRVRRELAHSERSRRSAGRPALVWGLVGAGAGAWALGQIGWTVYEVGLGMQPPQVSACDAAFLCFPALVTVALLSTVHTPAGRLSQLRGMVEGLFIAAGFFLLSWSVIVSSAIAHTHASTFGEAVKLAYPMLDAIALTTVLFVALQRTARSMPGLGLLGLGIVSFALSDSLYWYLSTIHTSFPGVSPAGTGWVAGFLLIALAALERASAGPRRWRLPDRRVLLVAPVLPAGLGLLALLARLSAGDSVGSLGAPLGIVAAVVVLAIVLLVIVTYENRALTDDLERRVRERTAELHATERYFRALVHRSSDVVMVVDRNLTIAYVSDSVRDVFGFEPQQLAGHPLSVLGADAQSTLVAAFEHTTQAPEHASRARWVWRDASRRERSAESTITNLLGEPDVGAFVVNTRDDTDRVTLEEELRHRAFHDELTGLSNRALLSDRAAQALARSLRTGAKLAVIVLDLDAFKLVNDSRGHEAGDALLREAAQRLHAAARAEDTVARIGGDEFVVLVEEVSSEQHALAMAERLRAAVSIPGELERGECGMTASVGVAVATASEKGFEALLRDADTAMYSVKAGGKDAVQLFDPLMHQQAHERLELQADLAKGLARGELWLLYQPEFELAGSRLVGFEALVRWNHPRRGLVPPDQFIPLAEESGLIVALGRWVLVEAMREAAAWGEIGAASGPVSIAVNVSAVQLKAPSLIADVKHALEVSKIDPARVILEITESLLVDESQLVSGVLRALKQLGVRIAIDDFGTGYASLAYLRSMPVDMLKIDQAFVHASNDGARGRDLLEAIVSIGRSLRLQTVAEGIEQADQIEAVRRMGCELVQGHLLGRPLPAEEARRLIIEQVAPAAL